MNDPILQVQLDIVGRLESDPFFSDLPIIQERKGVTEKEVAEALNIRLKKDGKTGAAIIVMMPERSVQNPDAPGPQNVVSTTLRVLTIPLLAQAIGGAKKEASRIGLYLQQIFHLWQVGPTTVQNTKVLPYNDGQGTTGEDVILESFLQLPWAQKTLPARISGTASAVTLTSNTAGASLFYSTDGSFPSSPYTAPFSATGLVRSRATSTGLAGSDIAEQDFYVTPPPAPVDQPPVTQF